MSDGGFKTSGLRYNRPGGYPSPRHQPKDWRCPNCGRENRRYLVQCGQCMTRRPKEA